MAAAATQSYVDAQKVLKSFKTQGVSQAESDEYVKGAIDALQNDNSGQFADNVSQVGTWAVQVDEAFNHVTKGLTNLTAEFGGDFPSLSGYRDEWARYNAAWIRHLLLSRDVASEHVAVLTRFDRVFLDMVQSIQTDQDRLDVIAELGQFANEKHDRSAEMSKGFMDIKNDVESFVIRFDAWVATTSAELQERAKQLQVEIDDLKKEIQGLDKEIQEATKALLESAPGAATMVGVVGLVVAGTTVAILLAARIVKTVELSDRKKELVEVNRKQQALAKIKSDFDGLRPDIALICEKLVLFAQIWSSVQSQTLAFQETLKGGMAALQTERFKNEITLARKLCLPLKDGLTQYATNLASRN